jgi:uncharacterized protein DUF6527
VIWLRRIWASGARILLAVASRYFGSAYRIAVVEELPSKLHRRTLYVVAERGLQMQASMVCPEGCGTIINLNLLPDDHPVWRLSVDSLQRPTLHPSIWRREGCGAHFFLRAGRLTWCHQERARPSNTTRRP